MRTSKGLRMAVVLGAIVVIGAAALSSGTVAAARGGGGGGKHGGGQTGGGGTGTIALNQTDPRLGDTVTFTTTGGSTIVLMCTGVSIFDPVYSAIQPVGTAFLLGGTSSEWLTRGGGAWCEADLYTSYPGGTRLSLMSFYALGAR